MLISFLALVAYFPPKQAPNRLSPPDCYRLAWLNLETAELGHGFCREEDTFEHLLSVTRGSTVAVYWVEKVDCGKVRGTNVCDWGKNGSPTPPHAK